MSDSNFSKVQHLHTQAPPIYIISIQNGSVFDCQTRTGRVADEAMGLQTDVQAIP
jgi:hypothetical protein